MVHNKPIAERIDWLLNLAQRHTAEYRSPGACLARDLYLARHPTAIMVLKCMDGRINLPVVTGTPPGIIQPFRNLGGMFDLGWPHLGEVVSSYVQQMIAQGRRVLFIITYHFSKGSEKRGCAGFNYNTAAALGHTGCIKQQAEQIFGANHSAVFPLICGFETDDEALLLHGRDGQVLDLSTIPQNQASSLSERISELYPQMPEQMKTDLLRLLRGNLEWIAKARKENRELEFEHREWMICLGRGFDFLHTPNLALIIGPYSPDLADPIIKAAGIIDQNMKRGRIPDDGFLLFTSAPYDEIGMDEARAELKSHFLGSFASEVINSRFPELASKMRVKSAIISRNSKGLKILDANFQACSIQ